MKGSPLSWNRQKLTRWTVSVFLLFHILAITCWAVPLETPLVARFRTLIRPYMLWSGLFQAWDMFAPGPRSINAYIQGVVITHDGRLHTWKFPRMEQLGIAQRYYKERYRKFEENLPEKQNAAILPDVARHLARMYRNPSNPPEIVMLVRYWSDITPPSDGEYHPGPERANIFYEYRVTPEDLK